MLLVLCVDLDDDLGRKTGVETPVVGRDAVEEAAVALATADPEDSDVNVLFEGVRIADAVAAESRAGVADARGADADADHRAPAGGDDGAGLPGSDAVGDGDARGADDPGGAVPSDDGTAPADGGVAPDGDGHGTGAGDVAADGEAGESVTVAAVAGADAGDVAATRAVGEELDEVLASLSTGERVRALVVTDGAQDESVIPAIRSRVPVDGVRRVVVRQAQDLESMYYTIKQVLNDPETRGTVLVPLGILLLIYPLAVVGTFLNVTAGAVLGTISALLGLYVIGRGIGIEDRVDDLVDRARRSLYAGRVTLVAYVVAFALLAIGAVSGVDALEATQADSGVALGALEVLMALFYGSVRWFAAAGVTTSLGQITDEYLADDLEWRYLNAPFYVVAIGAVLHAVSAHFVAGLSLEAMAAVLTGGTILGIASTLAFAVAEQRFPRTPAEADRDPEAPT